MAKKYGNEFKVGIFVLLCIVGLLYLVLSTGKLGVKQGGYYIYVVFDDIAGLDTKAPVMLNGREVGKVDDIRISYQDNATTNILKLWLSEEAKIRNKAIVSIKTLGLMGEKFIQISSNEGDVFIEPNTVLKGRPFMDIDVLMEQAQAVADDVGVLVNNVNSLTDEVKKLAVNLNGTVEGNQDAIGRIIKNLEMTSKNVEELTADLKSNPWKLLHRPPKSRSATGRR